MIQDWFASEGMIVLSWWVLVTLAGAAVMPLCLRLFTGLADRGYTLARTVGMLLVGFVFWLLTSFGFLQNSAGSMVMAWVIVLVLSLLAFFSLGQRFDLRAYWRDNAKVIIVAEVLFFSMLLAWAIYRAFQNDTSSTEKPMELAFISGIMRSETFPPIDPWLSGYAISYYYFGYVMSAMLSTLSGVSSAVGFSMTTALLFALTGLTSFGVMVNLVRSRMRLHPEPDAHDDSQPHHADAPARYSRRYNPALVAGLMAAVFVTLLGNFQLPLIEVGYQSQSLPEEYFEWWGVQARSNFGEGDMPRYEQQNPLFSITPLDQWRDGWWWFRASRVLTDYDLNGNPTGVQPIDEFPAFSFILADNHPHVLALPFVLMAIGAAMNLLFTWRDPNRYEILFYGIMVGGLIFLNAWDGPIWLIALVGTDALRRLMRNGGYLRLADWASLVLLGLVLAAIAIIAYLPFFIGFRSQAAGLIPNLTTPTLFRRFFLMFGPLLLLTGAFIAVEVWRGMRYRRMNWWIGLQTAGGFLVVLLFIMALLAAIAAAVPEINNSVARFIAQNGGLGNLLPALLERRLTYALTSLVLLGVIMLVVARLFPPLAIWNRPIERVQKRRDIEENPTLPDITYPPATGFALLLVAIAATLTLVPEFVFLGDNFGVRINTIFKFYYQAWIVLSLVSAYGLYTILSDIALPRPALPLRAVYVGVLGVVLFLGLMYPVAGVHTRAIIETGRARAINPAPLTLDGGSRMPLTFDDYEVIQCLNDLVVGDDVVAVEAEQLPYRSHYGRLASITGIPVVMGWANHQSQWRGAAYGELAGTRLQDIRTLYTDLRWDVVVPIIERYDIDYIMYGATERNQYGAAGEDKFAEMLDVVCEAGDSRIYRVDDKALDILRN